MRFGDSDNTLNFLVPSGTTSDVNYLLNKHLLSIASTSGISNLPSRMSSVQMFQRKVFTSGCSYRTDGEFISWDVHIYLGFLNLRSRNY